QAETLYMVNTYLDKMPKEGYQEDPDNDRNVLKLIMNMTHLRPRNLQSRDQRPVPKFKGDKRMFESWYASFYQTIGKYEKVPPEQKLLRLYSCLEGDALHTVQNLGYSAAAYDVAMTRLIRKNGGKRREISMRLEDLDKFRRVREL
ncbi:hypothetical protein QZH41_017317, partial [Actinostola sp. cb2023]